MNFLKLIPLILFSQLPLSAEPLGQVEVETMNTQISVLDGTPQIRLSWKIKVDGRAQLQTGYQILLAEKEEQLQEDENLTWDSGRVDSSDSLFANYRGPKLKKGTPYYWKIQLTNTKKKQGPWSKVSKFEIHEGTNQVKPNLESNEPRSTYKCSDTALNELFLAAIASREASLQSPPSFKIKNQSWGAPLQLSARGYSFATNSDGFYKEWYKQFLANTSTEENLFPATESKKFNATIAGHSEAGLFIPFALWQLSGDNSWVEEAFQPAVAHTGAVQHIDSEFLGKIYGKESQDIGFQDLETSPEFLSLCNFGLSCRMLAEMANQQGHMPYIVQHHAWFDNIRKGFKKSFLDENNELTEKSQTAQILALRYGLLPQEAKQQHADALAERLQKDGLKAGIFGQAAVLPVLSWTGHHEQAVALARSYAKEGANPSEVALATSAEWMMSFLAGFIHQAPGFKTSRVSPFIPSDGSITHLKASHETPYGTLAIEWETTKTGLKAKVTIPPNTTSIISLPGTEKAELTEGGKPLDEGVGCQLMKQLPDRKEIIAQSGTYHFELTNEKKS